MVFNTKEEAITNRKLELVKEIRELSEYLQDLCDELEYRVDARGYVQRYFDEYDKQHPPH